MTKLTERQELERASWQYKAIQATAGNQTRLGTILLAAIGRSAKHPPWFGNSAVITSDSFVMCDFTDKRYTQHSGAFVCSVTELRDNFRGLADHLKLGDKDREAMFAKVREWISHDYSNGTLDFKQEK